MKLTKNQQIRNLKKLLGSKADLFDLEAHVDGRLTYEENKNLVLNKARRRGITRKSKLKFKGTPVFYFDKAVKVQASRSKRSKALDSVKTATKTFKPKFLTAEQFFKWKRNPHRYDILAIDSRGSYAKKSKTKFKKLTLKQIDALDIL